MKKRILKIFTIIALFCFAVPCFQSCSDDLDGCGLTVVVKDASTGARLSGALIHIGQESGSIKKDGVSDTHGEAYFFFNNEAIFNISVTYAEGTRQGNSTVKLKYDKVVTKEVLVP
ncbi:MAG: hypothetical protein IJ213_07755 [Bacteroidales bacterium]|nr:hypothetical protein [Bacteroidales bacterium]MBQ9312920.1 hypothetical protein [Bacteroidales bacterium]